MKLLPFLLFACSLVAPLSAEGLIRLSASQDKINADSEFYVDIIVNDAPMVYGVQLKVKYDPDMFQVIDSDSKKKGIQISLGDFFNDKNLFTLKNTVDSEEGLIQYIVSQTAPAVEVHGGGRIARLSFKSTGKQGQGSIYLESSKFGTSSGKVVILALGSSLSFNVKDNSITLAQPKSNETNLTNSSELTLSNISILFIVVLVIAVTIIKLKKNNKGAGVV